MTSSFAMMGLYKGRISYYNYIIMYKKRTKKIFKNKRGMMKPAILRSLKKPLADGQQILKIVTLVPITAYTNTTPNPAQTGWAALVGPDGYYLSNGKAIGQPIAPNDFIAYANAEFNKMAMAY